MRTSSDISRQRLRIMYSEKEHDLPVIGRATQAKSWSVMTEEDNTLHDHRGAPLTWEWRDQRWRLPGTDTVTGSPFWCSLQTTLAGEEFIVFDFENCIGRDSVVEIRVFIRCVECKKHYINKTTHNLDAVSRCRCCFKVIGIRAIIQRWASSDEWNHRWTLPHNTCPLQKRQQLLSLAPVHDRTARRALKHPSSPSNGSRRPLRHVHDHGVQSVDRLKCSGVWRNISLQ